MKIAVERIKSEPTSIQEDILAKEWEMDSDDIKFINNIHIGCSFTAIHQEILVDADITAERKIICSRCLENVEQTLEQKFIRSYNRDDLGEYLDLDEDIREEIVMNFPMKILCGPECKGICSHCGTNLNIKNCECKKELKTNNRDIFKEVD